MSVSRLRSEIALVCCLTPKPKPQSSQILDAGTDERWKIGEGFMHIDNMFLAKLEFVSKGSFQPQVWVTNPAM